VHLTLTHPVHIAVWGVGVTTRVLSDTLALADVDISIRNNGSDLAKTRVITPLPIRVERLLQRLKPKRKLIRIAGTVSGRLLKYPIRFYGRLKPRNNILLT